MALSDQQIIAFKKRARAQGFNELQISQEIARKQQEETRTQLQRQQQPIQRAPQPVQRSTPPAPEKEKRTFGGLIKNAGQDALDFAVRTPFETIKNFAGVGFEGMRALDAGREERNALDIASGKKKATRKELEANTNRLAQKSAVQNPFTNVDALPGSMKELGGGILKNVGRTFGVTQDETGALVFDLDTAIQSAYEKPVSTILMAKDLKGALRKTTGKGITKPMADITPNKSTILNRTGDKMRRDVLNPQVDASPFYSQEVKALQDIQKKLGLKGSAKAQLEQLPDLFNKTDKEVRTLLGKSKTTPKGSLSNSFLRHVDDASYGLDDLQFSRAVENEMNILGKLDGKSPTELYEQLGKYRNLLKSTRRKIDNGTTLLPKEEARLAAFNALKEAIDTVSPEVRVLNTLQNQMFNISEGLVKSSKKEGFGVGPVKVPNELTQSLTDTAGRVVPQIGGVTGIPGRVAGKIPQTPPGTGSAMILSDTQNTTQPAETGNDADGYPIEDGQDYGQQGYDNQDFQQDAQSISHPIFGDKTKRDVLLEAFKAGMNQNQLEEIAMIYDQFSNEEDQTQLSDTFLETGQPVTRADKMWLLENPDKAPGKTGAGGGTEKERMFQNAGYAAQQALDLLESGGISTGIGQGIAGSAGEKLGTNSMEQQRYRSSLALARTAARNALLGANMTEKEMESINAFIPEFNDAPETAREKLNTFIEMMDQFGGIGNMGAMEQTPSVKKKTVDKKTGDASASQSLVKGVDNLLKTITPEVSASGEGRTLTGMEIDGDTIIYKYRDGNGTYIERQEKLDDELGFTQKIGGALADLGKKIGAPEMNLSEILGYKTKEERLNALMEQKKMLDERRYGEPKSTRSTGKGMFEAKEAQAAGTDDEPKAKATTGKTRKYEDIIRKHFGDETDNVYWTLEAENGSLDPRAVNNQNDNGSTDRGLFQVNSVHFFNSGEFNRRKKKMAKAGIDVSSPEAAWEDMWDPDKNVAMAKIIWDEQGWDGWYGAPDSIISEKEKRRRIQEGFGRRE